MRCSISPNGSRLSLLAELHICSEENVSRHDEWMKEVQIRYWKIVKRREELFLKSYV